MQKNTLCQRNIYQNIKISVEVAGMVVYLILK